MGHIEIPHYLKGLLQVIGDKNSFQETVLKYEDQIIGPLADSITGNIRDYWYADQGDIPRVGGRGESYTQRERYRLRPSATFRIKERKVWKICQRRNKNGIKAN